MKKVFLKPVENSNGLLENGVGIVRLKLEWKDNKARTIEHINRILASKRKLLYNRIETKGMQRIKFSKTLIFIFDLSPKVDSKKSILFFSESLNCKLRQAKITMYLANSVLWKMNSESKTNAVNTKR